TWHPPGAIQEGSSFSIYTEESTATGIFFKPDGTKMYIVGSSGDDVNQYTLSTPWDVTTAATSSAPFPVDTEDTYPQGLFFKPDGTKMYIVGSSGDDVNPYTLSTAWDVTSATFDGVSFSVANESTYPRDVFFKPDGTKMYVSDQNTSSIVTYTLSPAWDVTSATFDGVPFSVANEGDRPLSIFFKPDGTEMYVSEDYPADIFTYSLSTPWDVTTASASNLSFRPNDDVNMTSDGIFFKPDGTMMYLVSEEDGYIDSVFTYAFDTSSQTASGTMTGTSAFNNVEILTASTTVFENNASTTNLTISAGTTTAPTIFSVAGDYTNNGIFNANSGKVFFDGTVQQTLSGPMTGTSAFNNLEITNTSQDGATNQSVIFSVVASTTDTFTMSDSTSAQFLASATSSFTNINLQGTSGNEIYLRSSSDGTQWGIAVTGTQYVSYVDVKDSNACDGDAIASISSTLSNTTCWSNGSFTTISGTLYSDEGSTEITGGKPITLVVGTSDLDNIYSTTTESGSGTFIFNVFPSSVSEDAPIVAYVDGVSTTRAVTVTKASSSNPISNIDLYQDTVIVKHEATTGTSSITIADMAIYDSTDDDDIRYTASSTLNTLELLTSSTTQELHVWIGDTFTADGEVSLHTSTTSDSSLHVDNSAVLNFNDTSSIYGSVAIDTGAILNLGAKTEVNGDVVIDTSATLSAPISSNLILRGDYTNNGTFAHNNGNIVLTAGGWTLTSNYATSTPFDVSTEDTSPRGFFFKPDGTKMYMLGYNDEDINSYTLSTAWDVTTATFDGSPFSISTEDICPQDLFFKPDGTKMYMLGDCDEEINTYTLGTPWDVSTASFDGSPFSVSTEESSGRGLFFKPDGTKMYVIGSQGDDVNT
ncbi:hypothetical protein OAD26_00615, partial [bacterium]|nr:hypothetical protein [bacterium]